MFVPLLGGTRMACIVLDRDVFIPLVRPTCMFHYISHHLRLSILSDTLIIDWTTRCRCACGTYHRVSRHTRTISHRTARHTLLAPILSTRTHKHNHDNEHREPSYSDGICSPLTLRRTPPASAFRVKFRCERLLSIDHLSRTIPSCQGCGWGARIRTIGR